MQGHIRAKLLEIWDNAYFPEDTVRVYLEQNKTDLMYDYFTDKVWTSRTIIDKDFGHLEERWMRLEGYVQTFRVYKEKSWD